MKENGREQNFAKILLQKYISALLAAFVFVMGMLAESSNTFAAPVTDTVQLASLAGELSKGIATSITARKIESYKRLITFNDGITMEGSAPLKPGKLVKNEYGLVTSQSISGEVAKGKTMKLHYLFKPIDLGELSKQRKKIEEELGGKPGKAVSPGSDQFTKRNSAISMQLTAKNGDKIIKEIKKSFKNQEDCVLEYQVPENATSVNVKINVTDVVQKDKVSQNKNGWLGLSQNKKQISVALKPVKKLAAPVASTDKSGSDGDSGGIGIVEIGGGLVLVAIGGYIGMQFIGGGAGSATAGEAGTGTALGLPPAEPDVPAEPPVPPQPKEYLYTDPAGFQTLYVQDPETGQWTNYETGNPVDMDSLQEYDKQRMQDMAWSRNETQKLSNRTTAFDNDLKQDYQKMLEEEAKIQQQTKKDMAAIKSGTYGMTDAERQAYLEERQAKLVADKEAADKKAKNLDTAVKTLEVIEKGADLSISVLSTVTPGGNLVANIYTGVKNVAVGGMQAAVDGKSIMGGIVKGAVKGGADILQSKTDKIPAGKWAYKLLAYAGTEAVKEGFVAYMDGENAVKIAKATYKGMVQGGSKFLVDQIGGALSDKAAANNNLAMKEKYLKIRDNWSKDLKPKSVKAVRTLNFQRYFAKEQTRKYVQGAGQTLANEASARSYEMGVEGKSFTESTFGDKW